MSEYERVAIVLHALGRRPTWDETWLVVADAIALRSVCSRSQVGAVIVSPTNRIVATGYNGPPSGWIPDTAGKLAEMPPDFYTNCAHWCPRSVHGPKPETR